MGCEPASVQGPIPERAVYIARAVSCAYEPVDAAPLPELPGVAPDTALLALRRLLQMSGLDQDRFGTADWNPLGELIQPGQRELIKPNWVSHRNKSGAGLDCLVTHTSVVAAIARYVARARPGELIAGDAPVQGCDFAALREACGLDRLAADLARDGLRMEIRDFRRTILPRASAGAIAREACRPLEKYVLFDLGGASMLEPISGDYRNFRVTMYDPEAMRKTHAPGRHQYLVAREVLDADLVINVPKLKTHKKAGVTGALKNVVGINGHKEYLPHHRKGGTREGGDCYAGGSMLKRWTEDLLDQVNRSRRGSVRYGLAQAARATLLAGRLTGKDRNLDGSWYGNDTVWRMVLDLLRVLHYGRADGTLALTPQRRVMTITDAIMAGEGEGPLAPTPIELGLMTLGMNVAAIEWVHALLMGLNPERLPVVREAFAEHRYPLAGFGPEAVEIHVDGEHLTSEQLVKTYARPFRPPDGWRGRCEFGPGAARCEASVEMT